MSLAMFTLENDQLIPTEFSRSMWSPDQMHGVAVSGALARALEVRLAEAGRGDLQPSRYTVDLFQPAKMVPSTVTTEVVRESRRLCLIDASLMQDGHRVARASCIFLLPTETPSGLVWTPDEHPEPPPLEVVPPSDEPRVPHFTSEAPWSQSFGDHQNRGRKQTWQAGLQVVGGEVGTPFQSVASIADATSMVVNWGSEGVQFINTDITLALARPPVSREIGLSATDRVEHDGISVGTVEVFDRAGPLGTAMVTAIANAARPVDFENVEFDDDGGRRTSGT
ncbi:acyl-CoA thioesterase domain-containing protein [Aeromicrobium sp.]|uniref:acyl-CoA thioesterase domain-containing protein n=1 Tax=Aeromicrobium sp. TaxID=1871063 RepID=UPI0030C30194